MRLLFLYGPPAAGKLTIARDVAARTGWRLFHNHLTVNLALALYDFGTPGFIALREKIWLDVLRYAMADTSLPGGLIFTFNPENSVPQRFIDELFAELTLQGGEVIAVELTAEERVIEARLANSSRVENGKLVDLALYRQLRAAGVFDSPVIPAAARLQLDTGKLSVGESVDRIVAVVSPERE